MAFGQAADRLRAAVLKLDFDLSEGEVLSERRMFGGHASASTE